MKDGRRGIKKISKGNEIETLYRSIDMHWSRYFIINQTSFKNNVTSRLMARDYYDGRRSSRPEVVCKYSALRNFAKFTGKLLYQSVFFSKIAGLRPATLLKRSPWHRFFQ